MKKDISESQVLTQIVTTPKYKPNEFWEKLEEILLKHYDPQTTERIIKHFRMVSVSVVFFLDLFNHEYDST